jgi:DNA polymerase-1
VSSSSVSWTWYDGHLPPGSELAFDVENDYYELKAAKIKKPTTITQCAVSNGTDTVVARGRELVEMLDDLQDGCVYGHFKLVAHNGWYADVPWIRATHPNFPYNQGETMALGYLMDENQSLSLKNLCMKYLPGTEDWKDGINAVQGSDEFAEYNAKDAAFTMRLFRCLTDQLGGRVRIADRIILPAMSALGACSDRGIWISPEAVRVADDFYSSKISVLLTRLKDEFDITNPNQRQVVADALLRDNHKLGKTKSNKLSTSKGTIARLKKTPLVSVLQEFWQLNKAYTAYVKRYQTISGMGDGRSHAPYSVIRMDGEKQHGDANKGTVTGRTSNSDQQLPREPMLRAFFSAPTGFRLVSADYNALQFRTAAWVAGEQGILERFRANPYFDPHRWFAAILYGKPEGEITDAERQIAKSANFGLLFMAQPGTLVEYVQKTTGRVLSVEEAVRIYNLWHTTMPGFGQGYRRIWEELKEFGYVESFTGRRRHFLGFGPGCVPGRMPRWKRQAALREAVNFKMGQAPESDITQIALAKCHQEGLPLNGFVHDSITFELSILTPEISERITYCMCDYPPKYLKEHFGVDFDMPLRLEIK